MFNSHSGKVIHQSSPGKVIKHISAFHHSYVSGASYSRERVVYDDHKVHRKKYSKHSSKHVRVIKESTSTSTEVVEKHLPVRKKIRNVVFERSQSTSTEVVEKIKPKRVKHKNIVQQIS